MGFQGSCLPVSIDEVEEAMVRCHGLWRRSPGGGRWPFAGDGPWHLMRRLDAGDYGGQGVDGVAAETAPRSPLRSVEVAERDRVTAWLQLVRSERDRKVVWIATGQLERGEGRPAWTAIGKAICADVGPRALASGYRRALVEIWVRLQGRPYAHVRRVLRQEGLARVPDGPAEAVRVFDGEERLVRRFGR